MSRALSRQAGVAAVEFALVCSVFFTALLGVVEFGRLLWTWNAATEATRLGARLAVVCDMNDTGIRRQMIERLPALGAQGAGEIVIDYLPDGCTVATCKAVRVWLKDYVHEMIIPFLPLTLTLPPFTTTLRREHMQSASNPVCS